MGPCCRHGTRALPLPLAQPLLVLRPVAWPRLPSAWLAPSLSENAAAAACRAPAQCLLLLPSVFCYCPVSLVTAQCLLLLPSVSYYCPVSLVTAQCLLLLQVMPVKSQRGIHDKRPVVWNERSFPMRGAIW